MGSVLWPNKQQFAWKYRNGCLLQFHHSVTRTEPFFHEGIFFNEFRYAGVQVPRRKRKLIDFPTSGPDYMPSGILGPGRFLLPLTSVPPGGDPLLRIALVLVVVLVIELTPCW
jgi:hypothetical protein